MKVRDRVLVVTGGGNGIGREVVLELLRRGASVAAVDVSAAGLAETAALAGSSDGRLSSYPLDITDRSAVEALPGRVACDLGAIDGLVNVAGIIHRFVPIAELAVEEVERVMAVNFWGTVYLSKAFLPVLAERPEASLVNVSSMGALIPFPGQSAYGASKAAVKLFTEGLIAELRGSSITPAVVFPGAVGTNMPLNSGVEIPSPRDASARQPKTTAPDDAGRQIVDVIEKGIQRWRIGGDARTLDRLARAMPLRSIGIIADRMKKMLT
jgi:NAD(P)-dependent dehydrogenase (short-subunit alcohol dehydrogenase family)